MANDGDYYGKVVSFRLDRDRADQLVQRYEGLTLSDVMRRLIDHALAGDPLPLPRGETVAASAHVAWAGPDGHTPVGPTVTVGPGLMESSGWCAPAAVFCTCGSTEWPHDCTLVVAEDVVDLPALAVARGGIDFNNPPQPAPPPQPPSEWCDGAAVDGQAGVPHQWERWISRGGCECPVCVPETPRRRVECAVCPAELREGDDGFEALWETARWP